VWSMDELEKITGKGGALEEAVRAREEGLIRYISISNHGNPAVLAEALRRFPFDSMLFPVSLLDHFILSFAEEVLPAAKARGTAVAGMKVLGLGALADIYEKALRYSFSLPIDTAVVGMDNIEQVKKNLAAAEAFKPLSDGERLELLREVLPRVKPENAPWKAENWGNPVEWLKR